VWRTPNTQATAATIIELVKSANKSQLSALARHLKISQPFNINKHVMTLMGVEFPKGQAGIGVILAEALIAHYGTAWNVFNSSPQNIADNIQGMGLVKARQLLSAIGRKV
jgi:ERCC4-type nuclease